MLDHTAMRRTAWFLVAAASAMALASCAGDASQGVRSTEGSTSATVAQPVEDPAGVSAVGDAAGNVRGSIDPDEAAARRRRVLDRVVTDGYVTKERSPDRLEKREILRALMTVDPVEVRSEKGEVVGYLTTQFVEAKDYPAERKAAEATLERLRP